MNKVGIRSAHPDDGARIAELSEVLGYPISAEAATSRLRHLLGRSDQIVLVAELGGKGVVGWIHAAEEQLLESEPRCQILGLIIAAEQRGQGTGRELVMRVEEWARARGLKQFSVRSNVLRAESHPFYQRLRFTRIKTQHVYRKQL
jgi:Predicted acetyltransferase